MTTANERKLAQLMKLIELGAIELPDVETDGEGAGFYADDLKPAKLTPELLERMKAAGIYHERATEPVRESVAPATLPAKRTRITADQYATSIEPTDTVTKQIFAAMPLNVQQRITMISKEKAPDNRDHVAELTIYRKIADNLTVLSAEHRRYYVAIANLMEIGINAVSPRQLYCMAWNDQNAKPSAAQLSRMYDCVRDMATMYIDMDMRDLANLWPKLDAFMRHNFVINGGQLISVTSWESANRNGEKVPYYTFGEMPLLWRMAWQMGHIATASEGSHAVGGGVTKRRAGRRLIAGGTKVTPRKTVGGLRNTTQNAAIKTIIADRLTALKSKNGGNVPERIPYESFYKAAGIDARKLTPEQLKYRRKTVRDKVKKQLDWLKADGQLSDWEQYPLDAPRPIGVELKAVGE